MGHEPPEEVQEAPAIAEDPTPLGQSWTDQKGHGCAERPQEPVPSLFWKLLLEHRRRGQSEKLHMGVGDGVRRSPF